MTGLNRIREIGGALRKLLLYRIIDDVDRSLSPHE
jgi:hypothetical protein